MLIDRWHEFGVLNERASPVAYRFINTFRRAAQRFQFSDEVTAMAAKRAAEHPNLLLRNYQFAVPPYRTTYIEYNAPIWVDAFGPDKYQTLEDADYKVGHFIHDGAMATLVDFEGLPPDRKHNKVSAGVCPWMYTFDDQRTYVKGLRQLRLSVREGKYTEETALAAVLLGSTLQHPKSGISDEIVTDLTNRVRLYFESNVKSDNAVELVRTFMGEIRTLWQLLLFLNQPNHIQFDEVAASRRFVGSKPVAFPSYRLVRIRPRTTIHHICRTMRDRMKPGLHQVREFWRNFDKNDNCAHDWPLLPNDDGEFHCRTCGQWRVRVKQHERGDPARPVMRKGYVV